MFSLDVIEAAKAHALAEFPRESVGFVVGGEYVPQINIAETPEEHFRVADSEYLQYAKDLQAVIHSHPDGPDHPSRHDMQQQIAMGVPWGIVVCREDHANEPFFWGDGVPVPPLVGRVFRHGVSDCYSLVRDYYRTEKNVLLPAHPRDDEWWLKGEDLYMQHFKPYGFATVAEPEPGDSFIAQVHSHVPNHAGVYVGDGLILHHLMNRLSRHEPAFNWHKLIRMWVRYVG